MASRPLVIEAVLLGDTSLTVVATADVVVATRDGDWQAVPLLVDHSRLKGEIPGGLVTSPEFSYYVRVVDSGGAVIHAPAGAPDGGLFTVPVSSRPEDPAEWRGVAVEIIYPLPDEVVTERAPHIAAAFSPALDEPWHAIVLLDGRDATDDAVITADAFVLSPTGVLERGSHRVTFAALTPSGAVEASWTFHVEERTDREAAREDWPPSWETVSDLAWGAADDSWLVSGRVEGGWAVVAAETTAVETTDVFLPYAEVSRPLVDLYVAGSRGTGSFLVTARHDPVYSDDLDWLVSGRTERFEVEAGQLFPSLSSTTLSWTVGHGAGVSARLGRSTTELLGMRIAEADTLAGFGIYSRFAAGAKHSVDWTKGVRTSLVYVSVFDREGSVPEEQRLSDPLRNTVVAGILRADRGTLTGEIEVGHSTTSGQTEGHGLALRAKLELERDWYNRVALEYSASEPGFYSGGTYEYDPGEHVLQLDYAVRSGDLFSSSGWVRAGRPSGSGTSLSTDDLEFRAYSRMELSWPTDGGRSRTYAAVRYDRVPYDSYDHSYLYGSLGAAWHRRSTSAVGSIGCSRTRSQSQTDARSASVDLRHRLADDRWTIRAAGRWVLADGSDTDYTRSHYTLETGWDFGSFELRAEYWLVDRDDSLDPIQTYAEHVFMLSVGRDL